MLLRSKLNKQVQSVEDEPPLSLLDLPDLVQESIFRRLSPESLCRLSQTCRNLRMKCRSDEIWEPLFHQRWGKIIGPTAFTAWERMTKGENAEILNRSYMPSCFWMLPLACIWSFSGHNDKKLLEEPSERFASMYSDLESGKLWFPAQVYNRQQGHVGFLLSCYDAELNYVRDSDTFCARYSPYYPRVIMEDEIPWARIRKPPVETSPSEFHNPDVAEEFRPGDHIEVQWKRCQYFPYGWWYGIVGHAANCTKDDQDCKCHLDEVLWLEFKQYIRGSRWRKVPIKRKRSREDSSQLDGFYGGIRKLYSEDEISTWLQLWPKQSLQ